MKKMVTVKNFAAVLAATIFLLGACKKGEAGPAGKDGANGLNGVVPMSTDGYIKGTITGTRQDGTPFNEAFDLRNYWGRQSCRLDSVGPSNYQFNIERGEELFGDNYSSINFNASSAAPTAGTMGLYLNFTKSLGTNKQFFFNSGTNNSVPISGLSYNTTTGLINGTFTYSVLGTQNTSGNPATITGSFQATVVRIYSKTGITNSSIKD